MEMVLLLTIKSNRRLAIGSAVLLLLGLACPVAAHNGAVALAAPVEGITVDGDLGDWPEDMRWYPIDRRESGDPLKDGADFKGEFRIGYNLQENALYVAVRTEDDSVVREPMEEAVYNSQEQCAIFLDVKNRDKEAAPLVYVLWGDNQHVYYRDRRRESTESVAVVANWDRASFQIEWKIDVGLVGEGGVSLRDRQFIGFDISLEDVDEDGSNSRISWGPGAGKSRAVERIGYVWMAEGDLTWGEVKGRVRWEDAEEGTALGKVRIQSLMSDELWMSVQTDTQGVYHAELPEGTYQIASGYRRLTTDSVKVEVQAGRETWVGESFFASPPLGEVIPAGSGKTREAGKDRVVRAGIGYRQGAWQTLGVPDGLLSSTVLAIYQDRQGYMWFGTMGGGVSRYDGQRFIHFTTEEGLVDNSVRAIAEDGKGNMWFGTQGGVSRYNGRTLKSFTADDGLAGNYVGSIAMDGKGRLWFGTSGGASCYDGQQFINFTIEDGLSHNFVECIVEDEDDRLWFGTRGGVSRYDGQQFISFTTGDGLGHNYVKAIAQDGEGNMWFGTRGGVSRYDGKEWTTFTVQDGLGFNQVFSIVEDREGNLWFGTLGGGVSRYDGRAFRTFTTEDGLAGNFGLSAFEDREGSLWFGTYQGVSRYDGQQFISFTTEDGLPDNVVTAILEDRQGNMWFGSEEGGVSRYDGREFVTFTTADGLGHDAVYAILQDSAGSLWFATLGGGVSRYDGKSWASLTAQDGLVDDSVYCIAEDRRGNLWFGTVKGVSRYDGEEFVNFTGENGLSENHVHSIVEDRQGNLWFATIGGGVNRYDGTTFEIFTPKEGLAWWSVLFGLEDRQGNLWFGTENGGVSRYDGQEFRNFTTLDGLANNVVISILEDRDDRLWFATASGMTRYDGSVFQNLLRQDGLIHDEIEDIHQSRNGDIWIATRGGLTRYRPRYTHPPVYISDVVTDQRLGPVEEIGLPSTQDFIAFEFQGVSFKTRPGKMIYAYRLEGYEEEWKHTRDNRMEYIDVPAGEYVFQVRAIDRDLNYSEQPATVKVVVHPPYGLIALWSGLGLAVVGLIIATGYGFRRNRARQQAERDLLHRMEQELEEARQLQLSMLPQNIPQIPHLDIAWDMETATEVGGDYYDYSLSDDGTLTLILGDATGHGMQAGTVVTATKSLFQTLSHQPSIVETFTTMSRSLKGMNLQRIGMAMNMVKIKGRTMRVSSAGIPPILLYRATTGQVEEVLIEGMPLGYSTLAQYEEQEFNLAVGDTILLMSDGLPERLNNKEEELGYPRTEELFREVAERSPEEVCQHLAQSGEEWAAGRPQDDDITFVVLKVK